MMMLSLAKVVTYLNAYHEQFIKMNTKCYVCPVIQRSDFLIAYAMNETLVVIVNIVLHSKGVNSFKQSASFL